MTTVRHSALINGSTETQGHIVDWVAVHVGARAFPPNRQGPPSLPVSRLSLAKGRASGDEAAYNGMKSTGNKTST